MASKMFPDMQTDFLDILNTLTGRVEAMAEQVTYKDIAAKLPHLRSSRVLGILSSLQNKGLAENRNGIWYRNEAGDRVVNR